MKSFIHLAFFIVSLAFPLSATSAESKIHVVIAVDGRAGLGANMHADYRNMERIFKENVPTARLGLIAIDREEITPNTILTIIAELQIAPNDTLVFYYSGHGAHDMIGGGQYLSLSDTRGNAVELQRRTLLSALKDKHARLTVLLTDTCNTPGRLATPGNGLSPLEKSFKTPSQPSPVFTALFLQPEGLVDITSSKSGEASLVDGTSKKRGSCFTWPFVELLEKHRNDAAFTWPVFVEKLKNDVTQAFLESYPDGVKFNNPILGQVSQKTQTVTVYGRLPGEVTIDEPVRQGPRFGVRAVTHPGGGVRITELVRNGPGHRAGFEVGDIILEINGKTIANEQDYSRAIDDSPKSVRAKVINVNDNRTIQVDFELAY